MPDIGNNTATNGAKDLLSKKYGPLPFGVWLIVIGGAGYLVRKLIIKQSASSSAGTNSTTLDAAGNPVVSAYTGLAGGVPFGSGSLTNAGGSGSPVTAATETSNEPWLRRVAEKLTAGGMWDPVYIQQALQTYIAGGTLDQKQQAVVNQGIKMEGQPPVNVVPGGTISGPNTSAVTRYLQIAGQSGIFAEYTDGTVRWIHDPTEWNAIRNGNPNVDTNPVLLPFSDPIWKRSDVYINKDPLYLINEQKSRDRTAPGTYDNFFLYSLPTNPGS